MSVDRRWLDEAVRRIEADYNRSADTHLIRLDLPPPPGSAARRQAADRNRFSASL